MPGPASPVRCDVATFRVARPMDWRFEVDRQLAEEEGFEPPCESPRKRFSRPPVSTTHPFLQNHRTRFPPEIRSPPELVNDYVDILESQPVGRVLPKQVSIPNVAADGHNASMSGLVHDGAFRCT